MTSDDLVELDLAQGIVATYITSLFWKNEFSKTLFGDFDNWSFSALIPKNYEFDGPINLRQDMFDWDMMESERWVGDFVEEHQDGFESPVLVAEDRNAGESDFADLFGAISESKWLLNSAVYKAAIDSNVKKTIGHLRNICLSFDVPIFLVESSKYERPSAILPGENAFAFVSAFDDMSFLIGRPN